jgi:hypothetical protein
VDGMRRSREWEIGAGRATQPGRKATVGFRHRSAVIAQRLPICRLMVRVRCGVRSSG